uniref:Uncharacterized protein n=1 Tax=Alexandrium catenella TaxID=2925 RepID=A0A7S1RXZ6_ALECA
MARIACHAVGPRALHCLVALTLSLGVDALRLQEESSRTLFGNASSASLPENATNTSQVNCAPEFWMLTFGKGKGFELAQKRLAGEARRTKLFSQISHLDDFPDFIKDDPKWARYLQIAKGAGYWFWKAPLASHLMKYHMREGDVLVYVDSGSELGDMNDFREVAQALCNHDLVAYALTLKEGMFTKGDLFAEFGAEPNDKYYGSPQLLATYFAIKNTAASRAFVDQWERLAANIRLIGDGPSKVANHPDFKEHRRDQSIFSMLVKANQPDFAPEVVRKFPNATGFQRHPVHGVEGLRPLIMQDPGYPQDPAHKWIAASRNNKPYRRYETNSSSTFTSADRDAIRSSLTSCREPSSSCSPESQA